MRTLLICCCICFTTLFLSAQVTILSGFEGGSYYKIANDIAEIMPVPVKVLPSKGSLDNFEQLPTFKQKGIDMGFVQFDVLYAGTIGMRDDLASLNYQVILPLGKEDIHLITKTNSGINSIQDLKGKRVGVGLTDQGTYVTALYVKRLINGDWNDIVVSLDNSVSALMDNYVDAFFFVGASPVAKLASVPQGIADKLKMVPIQHDSLQKLYSPEIIQAGTYSWQKEDIATYALGYALVTNVANETDADRARYTQLLTAIKNNIEKLETVGHPAWKDITFSFTNFIFPLHQTTKTVFGVK